MLRALLQKGHIFHLLFWIMYIVFMILEMQGYATKRGVLFCLLPLAIYFLLMAFLVYGNTLVLIPLLLDKHRIGLYVGGLFTITLVYTLLRSLNQQYWDHQVWPQETTSLLGYVQWGFLYAIWFLIISSMLFFTQQWYHQRQQAETAQISHLQSELKYLKAQVNPHFLFNGLNTIYGTINPDDQPALDMLLLFSNLLRYTLYEAAADWVTLEKEADFLSQYVALQRARTDDTVSIELRTELTDRALMVAPLLLIPFVENAFKFVSRVEGRPNFLRIRLYQQTDHIGFDCLNTFDQPSLSGGIGLTNVTRRLQLLYPDRHHLVIEPMWPVWHVHLTLTL